MTSNTREDDDEGEEEGEEDDVEGECGNVCRDCGAIAVRVQSWAAILAECVKPAAHHLANTMISPHT